jgi:hypothetical protein
MRPDDSRGDPIDQMLQVPTLQQLLKELRSGLSRYWTVAHQILKPCGVHVSPPGESAFSLPKNFFSLLFLYSYHRMGVPPRRRVLYAATLQCLRGMVTGCDNLLDDEYKPTLETDIPGTGYRFRSVVDIMVSDRVLFHLLTDAARKGEITDDRVLAASTASMHTMTRSGVQEAAEEAGIDVILAPQAILRSIHHYKTGLLFQCPWDIPRAIESIAKTELAPLLDGLYHIGMGCQILDDMVDLGADIREKRHNYLVSLIHHGIDGQEKTTLERTMSHEGQDHLQAVSIRQYPAAWRQAWETAHQWLRRGLETLFTPEDQTLVTPAIRFLGKRIGVNAPNPEIIP